MRNWRIMKLAGDLALLIVSGFTVFFSLGV